MTESVPTLPLITTRKRGPTSAQTHVKHLTAAGWVCIAPGTSLWRRIWIAIRGGK